MITVKRLQQIHIDDYDEVWAIMRSFRPKDMRIRHVPELSPSWNLFKQYLSLKNIGQWNDNIFAFYYVPQFLKEMHSPEAKRYLNFLATTKASVAIGCVCAEEELCHRSIIGGLLQGSGIEVSGLSQDYSFYLSQWKGE